MRFLMPAMMYTLLKCLKKMIENELKELKKEVENGLYPKDIQKRNHNAN